MLVLDYDSLWSEDSNRAALVTGRVYVPLPVRTVMTRTSPSRPGWVSMTLAIGHRVGTILSSRKTTMSPTAMFLEGRCHFVKFLETSKILR